MLTALGWLAALALGWAALRMRRRLELVARAAHELRGPATALGLAAAALRREPGGLRRALLFEGELERMRAGLGDLEAARGGRRAPPRARMVGMERLARRTAAGWRPSAQAAGRRLRFRWEGGPAVVHADPRRLSQALGNLVANAVEHGSGPVELRGRRRDDTVVVEVIDGGRGRGLSIAAEAVQEAGGRLELERGEHSTRAAVELPLAEP